MNEHEWFDMQAAAADATEDECPETIGELMQGEPPAGWPED